MTGLLPRMAALARLSVQNPRAAARVLLAEGVPLAARSAGLTLIAVVSAILLYPSFVLMPPEDIVSAFFAQSPLQTAVVQWLALLLSVVLIASVGRAFGGRGSLADAMLVVVWLQLLMLGVQVAQLLALVVLPPLAGLIGLIGFVGFVWLMVNFIAELHGFRSLGLVFGGIIVTFIAAAFVLAILLALTIGPEVLQNV
ncbi:MAG TPA: YIP1 family protein [Tabrizicola sp.]|nr:YIP1 family protein [Tabrizicola sp.]